MLMLMLMLQASVSAISFPFNENILLYQPLLLVEVDHLGHQAYPFIISKIKAEQRLMQLENVGINIVDTMVALAKLHDKYHLENFDYIQVQHFSLPLVRVRNRSANNGVSASEDVLLSEPPCGPLSYLYSWFEQLIGK